MEPLLYQPLFTYSVVALCVIMAYNYLSSPDYSLQEKPGPHILWLILLCLIYSFWLGNRPTHSCFGDSGPYRWGYEALEASFVEIDWTQEWLFQWIGVICKKLSFEWPDYFTVIALGYFFSALFAVKKFMPLNPMLGMLFILSSLSFYAYCVNGMRNGLACHIMLLAFAYLLEGKLPVGVALCLAAFAIHRTAILPIAGIFAAMYFVRDAKYGIMFWLASIVISLVAGNSMIDFFASLGFDDRMSSYANEADASVFSRTGFRWDFLLYSSMPIVLGWYVVIERKLVDNWYNALLVTYCLTNAFWVMVNEASYSNRFAYLSWFMYPVVIAYPLANMPIWEEQDKMTGRILMAYVGFTVFMNVVYWAN